MWSNIANIAAGISGVFGLIGFIVYVILRLTGQYSRLSLTKDIVEALKSHGITPETLSQLSPDNIADYLKSQHGISQEIINKIIYAETQSKGKMLFAVSIGLILLAAMIYISPYIFKGDPNGPPFTTTTTEPVYHPAPTTITNTTTVPSASTTTVMDALPINKEQFTNSLGMTFVKIPAGKFMMGTPPNEVPKVDELEKLHEVRMTKEFYMQTTEVTQGQWKKIMGNNPSEFQNCDNCPVENVSWYDAQDFIRKLNPKLRQESNKPQGAYKYRLPYEAEWEYACRARNTAMFCYGNDEIMLEEYAWYSMNAHGKTHPVAQKKPNVWGLYGMHGNVKEWCQDGYVSYSISVDPVGILNGRDKACRGGSIYDDPILCRAALRNHGSLIRRYSGTGFRLVIELKK